MMKEVKANRGSRTWHLYGSGVAASPHMGQVVFRNDLSRVIESLLYDENQKGNSRRGSVRVHVNNTTDYASLRVTYDPKTLRKTRPTVEYIDVGCQYFNKSQTKKLLRWLEGR